MGKDFYDKWAWGHLIGGMAYRVTIFPDDPLVSLILSVVIHFFIEIIEKKKHPITGGIESNLNHYGDMFFFIIGWFLAGTINPLIPKYKSPVWKSGLRWWLLVAVIIVTIIEAVRETYIKKDNPIARILLYN